MMPPSTAVGLVGALALSAGCLGPGETTRADAVFLHVDAESSAQRNATFRLALNGGAPLEVAVPYTGSAPNVRPAFDGSIAPGTLNVTVEETHSGARKDATFPLRDRNWVVVNFYDNGTLDIGWSGTPLVFD